MSIGGAARTLRAVEKLRSSRNESEFKAALQSSLAVFGLDHFIHTWLPHAHLSFEEAVGLKSWPDGWFETYCAEGFARQDPILKHCRTSSDPITWSDVKDKRCKVMNRAREFGMVAGFSLPVYGADKYAACFSACGDHAEINHSTKPALHMIALFAAERARAIESSRKAGDPLTSREKEILTWAAVGKTAADTAEILALSKRTVTAHTVNAMDKLGAANKTQAVVHALQNGLIDP